MEFNTRLQENTRLHKLVETTDEKLDPIKHQQGWRFDLVSSWRRGHTSGSRQDIHSARCLIRQDVCGWATTKSQRKRLCEWERHSLTSMIAESQYDYSNNRNTDERRADDRRNSDEWEAVRFRVPLSSTIDSCRDNTEVHHRFLEVTENDFLEDLTELSQWDRVRVIIPRVVRRVEKWQGFLERRERRKLNFERSVTISPLSWRRTSCHRSALGSRRRFTSRWKMSFTPLSAAHRNQIERNTRRTVYQYQDHYSNRVKVLCMNCCTQRRTIRTSTLPQWTGTFPSRDHQLHFYTDDWEDAREVQHDVNHHQSKESIRNTRVKDFIVTDGACSWRTYGMSGTEFKEFDPWSSEAIDDENKQTHCMDSIDRTLKDTSVSLSDFTEQLDTTHEHLTRWQRASLNRPRASRRSRRSERTSIRSSNPKHNQVVETATRLELFQETVHVNVKMKSYPSS